MPPTVFVKLLEARRRGRPGMIDHETNEVVNPISWVLSDSDHEHAFFLNIYKLGFATMFVFCAFTCCIMGCSGCVDTMEARRRRQEWEEWDKSEASRPSSPVSCPEGTVKTVRSFSLMMDQALLTSPMIEEGRRLAQADREGTCGTGRSLSRFTTIKDVDEEVTSSSLVALLITRSVVDNLIATTTSPLSPLAARRAGGGVAESSGGLCRASPERTATARRDAARDAPTLAR